MPIKYMDDNVDLTDKCGLIVYIWRESNEYRRNIAFKFNR